MTEEEIRMEICSVFETAFGGDISFPFKFLQSVSGGSRALMVPCTSSSSTWSVKDLISSAGKGAIYILAGKDTILPTDKQLDKPGSDYSESLSEQESWR